MRQVRNFALHNHPKEKKVMILWGNWGPYHYARLAALTEVAKDYQWHVTGVEFFQKSGVYAWQYSSTLSNVVHLNCGQDERQLPVLSILKAFWPLLRRERPDVVLVPSYVGWAILANVLCRCVGARIVMMNDTHQGTAKVTTGAKLLLKKLVAKSFHAALVAGIPQRQYFAGLGMPSSSIFTGYDCVDNEYYAGRCAHARDHVDEVRVKWSLPQNYFLSLGRMVEKKNLPTLLRAYAQFQSRCHTDYKMVFVGSGPVLDVLKGICEELTLSHWDHADTRGNPDPNAFVHFYGFQQVEDSPEFYALADAFILPSTSEEWGLVINEAMASSLPVIVSREVGCSQDLLECLDVNQDAGNTMTEVGAGSSSLGIGVRKNGFVFDPSSVEELSRGLESLALASEQTRERMGRESRRIVEKFSCRNFALNTLRASYAALGGINFDDDFGVPTTASYEGEPKIPVSLTR